MAKKTRAETRAERYQKLVNAGYSSKEATKYKSRSDKNIETLVREKAKEISRETRNAQRRENYKLAKEKGYTPKEARNIRTFGQDKINVLREETVTPKNKNKILKKIQAIVPGKAFTLPPMQPVDFTKKIYLEDYSYLIEYKTATGEKDFITITSRHKLTAKEVEKQAKKILKDGVNQKLRKYAELPPMVNSIKCIGAFYNPHAGNRQRIKDEQLKAVKEKAINETKKNLKKSKKK